MKLRIRGNSLRLRLLRPEVEGFGTIGQIEEKIQFGVSPEEQIIYSLVADGSGSESTEIKASFAKNKITVKIPIAVAQNWVKTDKVSLCGEQLIENETTLKILIEKDFVCLDRKDDAENADAFPHPTGKCG